MIGCEVSGYLVIKTFECQILGGREENPSEQFACIFFAKSIRADGPYAYAFVHDDWSYSIVDSAKCFHVVAQMTYGEIA
ncbi:hypothetical protein Tco_0298411 [Tanacetum coccineum]